MHPEFLYKGLVGRQPLPGTCQNPRLLEGKQVFSVNHMVLHNLGRGSQNYCHFWEWWEHSEFSDTCKASQGQPCKQVFHRRAVRSVVLIFFAHTHTHIHTHTHPLFKGPSSCTIHQSSLTSMLHPNSQCKASQLHNSTLFLLGSLGPGRFSLNPWGQ